MRHPRGTGLEEGGHSFRGRRRYRSLYWAIVLIGAGVVWLLYNAGALDSSNVAALGLVWPILLIGIGTDLLVGRRSLGLGVHMQPGQAFRVEVKDIASGSVKLPDGMVVVAGGGDGEGVWETPGYPSAPYQTSIVIESMSSGNVHIVVGG